METRFEKLKRLFGEDFAKKYMQALSEAQKVSREKLEDIKRFALNTIKNTEDFRVKYDKYDVILVQVPQIPNVKRTSSGNYKVGLLWPGAKSISGPWISAFFASKEEAEMVANRPGDFFLLVGKIRTREYMGGPTFSINVAGVIELSEEEVPEEAAEEVAKPESEEEFYGGFVK